MRYLIPLFITCTGLLAACGNNAGHKQNQPAEHKTATAALPRPPDMPPNIIIRSIAGGDLNKDNLSDSVIVTIDTAIADWPVTIKVFLATGSGYQLAAATNKAVAPVKPDGNDNGNDFDTATIENGLLLVSEQLLRGHNDYKYRYQNGHFELIGYTSGYADGGKLYTEDYNLMTGRLLYEEIEQETDEPVKKRDLRVHIQRPVLENFEAGETEVKAGDVTIFL